MKHDKENCPQTTLSHALSAEKSDNTLTSNEPNMMAFILIFHLFKTYILIKLTQVSKEHTAIIIDLKYPSFSTSFQVFKGAVFCLRREHCIERVITGMES